MDPHSTSITYLWLSVCDFWLICTGCMWRDKSVHAHGSSGLHNCAKSRADSVCVIGLCYSSKELSPVLHPESCNIGVIINYCQWSWAYGLKRVLNDFVFSFIVTYLIHTTRQHKALDSLHRSLVYNIERTQSNAYFSCPLEMNYCCLCFVQMLGNRFLHIYHILLASKSLKPQLHEI